MEIKLKYKAEKGYKIGEEIVLCFAEHIVVLAENEV